MGKEDKKDIKIGIIDDFEAIYRDLDDAVAEGLALRKILKEGIPAELRFGSIQLIVDGKPMGPPLDVSDLGPPRKDQYNDPILWAEAGKGAPTEDFTEWIAPYFNFNTIRCTKCGKRPKDTTSEDGYWRLRLICGVDESLCPACDAKED